MSFLATTPIFSLVNIFIVLKICSYLWMISYFSEGFPLIGSALRCIFVQSEVMSNFLWIHLPQRGG